MNSSCLKHEDYNVSVVLMQCKEIAESLQVPSWIGIIWAVVSVDLIAIDLNQNAFEWTERLF